MPLRPFVHCSGRSGQIKFSSESVKVQRWPIADRHDCLSLYGNDGNSAAKRLVRRTNVAHSRLHVWFKYGFTSAPTVATRFLLSVSRRGSRAASSKSSCACTRTRPIPQRRFFNEWPATESGLLARNCDMCHCQTNCLEVRQNVDYPLLHDGFTLRLGGYLGCIIDDI